MRSAAPLTLVTLLLLFAAACDEPAAPSAPLEVSVRAEILEADVPATVEATEVREDQDGRLTHGVLVEWGGDEPVRLDDARFTHRIEGGDGELIITGRGCVPSWDGQRDEVQLVCTGDLQIIVLEPGEAHEYPVTVYAEVGPHRLAPGTYVVEEVIHWWDPEDFGVAPHQDTYEGRFTIRLTYEVR